MSIFKYAVLGAAVAYGINYITKKGPDGTSILDELNEKAPEWLERGKQYTEQTINQARDHVNHYNDTEVNNQS